MWCILDPATEARKRGGRRRRSVGKLISNARSSVQGFACFSFDAPDRDIQYTFLMGAAKVGATVYAYRDAYGETLFFDEPSSTPDRKLRISCPGGLIGISLVPVDFPVLFRTEHSSDVETTAEDRHAEPPRTALSGRSVFSQILCKHRGGVQ